MSARIVGSAFRTDGASDLEDRFPGRWSPRRAIQSDLRPLAQAVADAAHAAGWWSPGEGRTIDAGLVVGVDLHGWGHMERWLQSLGKLAVGQTALRPSTFLHALPSTPAATLGLLFGLERYQATLDTGCLSGFAALSHGLDLLATGRVPRVVVASLSAVEASVAARLPWVGDQAFCAGAALCLDPAPGRPRVVACTPQAGDGGRGALDAAALLGDVAPGYRALAAPALEAVARAAHRAGEHSVAHRDPCFAAQGVARVEGA